MELFSYLMLLWPLSPLWTPRMVSQTHSVTWLVSKHHTYVVSQQAFIVSKQAYIATQQAFIVSKQAYIATQQAFIVSKHHTYVVSQQAFIVSKQAYIATQQAFKQAYMFSFPFVQCQWWSLHTIKLSGLRNHSITLPSTPR